MGTDDVAVVAQSNASVEELLKSEPTKKIGPKDGNGPCACMWMNKLNGNTTNVIKIQKGFSWRDCVKPILPGNPDWCPATHFGYIAEGCMEVEMQDGKKFTVKKGETYHVPPGHLPHVNEDTVMVEFTMDTTYTNKDFVKAENK